MTDSNNFKEQVVSNNQNDKPLIVQVPVNRLIWTQVEIEVPASCRTQEAVQEYLYDAVNNHEFDDKFEDEYMYMPNGNDWEFDTDFFHDANMDNSKFNKLPKSALSEALDEQREKVEQSGVNEPKAPSDKTEER